MKTASPRISGPIPCHKLVTGTTWSLTGNSFDEFEINETPNAAFAIDKNGLILELGKASNLSKKYSPETTHHFSESVILPGFIDSHIHFPQILQIGRFGHSLLGWLDKFIYPEEIRMSKPEVAQLFAPVFFQELISHGTTSALILSTSDFDTTDILFKAAHQLNFQAVIGKVSMDRLAPKPLLVKSAQDLQESEQIIKDWHKKGRLLYALTPRFSPACSPSLLKGLGDLAEKYSDTRIQTHFSENQEELTLVKKMFPRSRNYLDTYNEFGLLTDRTVLAHAIHATSAEIRGISKKASSVAHCPSANLFLGSGLFPFEKYLKAKVQVAIGTDIGAGTDFSIWKTLASAYSVQHLQKVSLTPGQLLYLATQAGAKALGVSSITGELVPGKQADFQVINWKKSRRLKYQMEQTKNASERFFSLLFQFEPSLLEAVFVSGKNQLNL